MSNINIVSKVLTINSTEVVPSYFKQVGLLKQYQNIYQLDSSLVIEEPSFIISRFNLDHINILTVAPIAWVDLNHKRFGISKNKTTKFIYVNHTYYELNYDCDEEDFKKLVSKSLIKFINFEKTFEILNIKTNNELLTLKRTNLMEGETEWKGE